MIGSSCLGFLVCGKHLCFETILITFVFFFSSMNIQYTLFEEKYKWFYLEILKVLFFNFECPDLFFILNNLPFKCQYYKLNKGLEFFVNMSTRLIPCLQTITLEKLTYL